ncbi:MAG: hypothetical protein LBR40_02050 [Bacilli bacterium]|jgi:3-phosphoshikimate 1-carboxyvinyltransferase|nr:hypothetical protein [Bacilli bacterium]
MDNNNIIYIEDNLDDKINSIINNDIFFIVIDKKVKLLFEDKLAFLFSKAKDILVIESEEENKSEIKLYEIYQMLYDNNANRHNYIIAIGGGIITDLAGYACATYMRGLKLINIPTTLLGMVDASIGDKVAINKFNIKNIIGTFYHPSAIIIDLSFLDTLTSRVFGNGLVEIIKCGLIKDESIIDSLENYLTIKELRKNEELVLELISKSINIKLNIIKEDYFDHDYRHLLNYGHSIAHCIELDYDIYHGEALALGILINIASTNDIESFYKIKKIFHKFNLIRKIKEIDFSKLNYDKKSNNDYINEIFIEDKIPIIEKISKQELINKYQKAYQVIKKNLKMKDTSFHFYPHKLAGKVNVGPSKSYMHRYLLASFLAKDITILDNVNSLNNDIMTTINALKKFNIKIEYKNNQLIIDSTQTTYLDKVNINMHESASSLRILLPTLMALSNTLCIEGENNLINRPLEVYTKLFDEQNIEYHQEDKQLPIRIKGALKAKHYIIDGSISSQFLSGLLFYLPLLNETSIISIRNELVSKSYIDLTLKVLDDFGIWITNINYNQFIIKEKQKYTSKKHYHMEMDYSSYLYYEALQCFNEDIILDNKEISLQKDSHIIEQFKNKNYDFDLINNIDAAPILSVLLATTGGSLTNIVPLKYKESNRLEAIKEYLNKFSIKYELLNNKLIIYQSNPHPNSFNTYHDHRIALSLICACNIFNIEIIINEVASINKSIFNFLETYTSIGGIYDEE